MRDHIGGHMRSRRYLRRGEGNAFALAGKHVCQNASAALPQRDDTATLGATILAQAAVDTVRTSVQGPHVPADESTVDLNRAGQHHAFGLSLDCFA